jgi:hypothetical protein
MSCGGICGCDSDNDNISTRRGQEIPLLNYNPKQNTNPATLEEDSKKSWEQGFAEGFKQAREVFWEEFQIKASDANMVAKYLNESDSTSLEADAFRITAAAYLHAADVLLMDRREYPGYSDSDDCN